MSNTLGQGINNLDLSLPVIDRYLKDERQRGDFVACAVVLCAVIEAAVGGASKQLPHLQPAGTCGLKRVRVNILVDGEDKADWSRRKLCISVSYQKTADLERIEKGENRIPQNCIQAVRSWNL